MCTEGESLSFVGPFTFPKQSISIRPKATCLSEKMKLPVSQEGAKLVASPRHSIILRNNQVKPVLEGVSDHEAYAVEVDPSNKSIQNNEKEAKRCLLTDPNETSHSFSVQMMVENSMNPDLESTFTFVDEVVKSVGPYSRSKFPNHILVHFCWNVWESGQAYDAHKLANEVYEVILAPDTHLYFDHPYEPDPEERGLYWACCYLDTHKVFRFVPENLMFNADVKLTGEKITKLDLQLLREFEDFTELKKPKNITGIQGQIWTESVIFPLLIALAERAWHKAPWEDVDPKKRKPKEDEDWSVFAHMLGNKELQIFSTTSLHLAQAPTMDVTTV